MIKDIENIPCVDDRSITCIHGLSVCCPNKKGFCCTLRFCFINSKSKYLGCKWKYFYNKFEKYYMIL